MHKRGCKWRVVRGVLLHAQHGFTHILKLEQHVWRRKLDRRAKVAQHKPAIRGHKHVVILEVQVAHVVYIQVQQPLQAHTATNTTGDSVHRTHTHRG